MRNTILIFLVIVVPAIMNFGCASTKEKVIENYAGRRIVKTIEFVNNSSYKDKALRKKLDFKVGDNLDTFLAESGRITISEFYRKKGFADIKVTLDTEELSKGNVVYIIEEGPRLRIRSVNFKGNKAIKTSDLRAVTKTKTRTWYFGPVYYNEEKIAADVEKLQNIYFQRGFLNYDIKAVGRSDITFLIDEGPQYKVGNINISGNTSFSSEQLLKGLELKSGQIYYPKKAEAQAKRILKIYHENGYIDARVQQQHNFTDDANDIVNLEFRISEGKQFRIGRIDIIGNEQTQDKVIRRVLDEYDFTPGKLYNADIAPIQGGGNLESRVQRATLAEEVNIRPVISEENVDNSMDVQVDVKEGLTGMWNPGVAYSSDDGVIGQLFWEQRNFDITDWPESFGEFITMQSFKGAGQSLKISLLPGREVSQYSVQFTEPYFHDKPTSFSVAGQSWERWYESHDEKRKKVYVGFRKRYKNFWRTSLGLRVEDVEIFDIDYDAPQKIIDYNGHNLLIGTRFGIGLDTTDDIFIPSQGYAFNLSYEQVTGDDDFGILEGSNVWYNTLYEDIRERKTILATKLLAATTLSNAPPFEKFYAGGTGVYGIRGFEYRGVSTRGLQTGVIDPQRKDPIGSDYIFLANTELTVPLAGDNIGMLFFMDSGMIDSGPYRVSIGTGLQVMVPQFLGALPIRFTVASPLKKDDEDETQAFNFFMGGMFQY